MKRAGVKMAVMLAAFVLFASGVWVLSLEPGSGRSLLLGVIVGAMLCLAGWVTYLRSRRPKK